jgi:glutamine phosphoribosylpyrophosphate amidotransferase
LKPCSTSKNLKNKTLIIDNHLQANAGNMRRYILTENDTEILQKWITSDYEDQQTRNHFSQIRKNTSRIQEDASLILIVIRKLRRKRRWRGRASPRDEFGRTYLCAQSKMRILKAQ